MTKEYSDYLAHYGVLGMKWGVHRAAKDKVAGKGRRAKPESATWKSRDKRKLSDDELNRRNQRLSKENQYVQNVQNNHPVRKQIKDYAKQIFVAAAVGAVADIVRKKVGATAAVGFIKKCATYKLPL